MSTLCKFFNSSVLFSKIRGTHPKIKRLSKSLGVKFKEVTNFID